MLNKTGIFETNVTDTKNVNIDTVKSFIKNYKQRLVGEFMNT